MERTFNTLFMLMSLDGKISTGSSDDRDVDKDYKTIAGLQEGLKQYYDLERQTDRVSLNTGKVMAKIGVNSDNSPIRAKDMSFVVVDNNNLTVKGISNLTSNLSKLYLVTRNPSHPAYQVSADNLIILKYENDIDFKDLFAKLKNEYNIEKITIQSGGTLNSVLIRNGLIDKVSIVVAPILIGGKDTSTLIDGESLLTQDDLKYIRALKLEKVEVLKHSYLHLTYEVINS